MLAHSVLAHSVLAAAHAICTHLSVIGEADRYLELAYVPIAIIELSLLSHRLSLIVCHQWYVTR